MLGIGIAKTMPTFTRRHRPAFCFINLLRLPDIEEPAVGLFAQTLHFFAKMQRSLHRTVNQSLSCIAAQHRRRRLY